MPLDNFHEPISKTKNVVELSFPTVFKRGKGCKDRNSVLEISIHQ